MAQFDVRPLRDGRGYVVDCQADFLSDIATRFVVPLLPLDLAEMRMDRLNPIFEIEGERFVFFPQLAASVRETELDRPVASLGEDYLTIGNALDMLISGF